MNLTIWDWAVVAVPLLLVAGIAIWTQRYARSVADFMSASRCAGRYLICNARGEAGYGAITAVAMFEMIFVAGFVMAWWQNLQAPVGLFIALSGYVIYRYRETRAMTLAQFFEIRYSRGFRIFAGVMAFVAGVVNYGIFPAVSSRFFVYFCGFPQTVHLGGVQVQTYVLLMALFLSLALALSLGGGQLTILVTDCVAGLVSGVFYLIVAFALLAIFKWNQIAEAMTQLPSGFSRMNPFDAASVRDFNLWYVLIGMVGAIYGCMSWQGGHAFNASAANPHEAKMGVILGHWRGFTLTVMITLLGVCAYTYMTHPDFAQGAGEVNALVAQIDSPQIQKQMKVPLALAHLLPVGVKGVLCAIMMFAMLAVDGSYLHSWGSIFIQDVVLPFRKKPFTPRQHLILLRLAIIWVAIYGFMFSWLFKQTDYILMFFALTGAIFSGAGAAIVGGLYWKKGTTAAAWTALCLGSGTAVTGIVIRQFIPDFFINGQWFYLIAMVAAVVAYVTVSLLTCKEDFNMDRMLHRGAYAPASGDGSRLEPTQAAAHQRFSWGKLLGFDKEFTRGDKFISGGLFCWSMTWFLVFLIGTLWNLLRPWPVAWWTSYWRIQGVLLPLCIGVLTTAWFTWGGLRDMRRMFRALKTVRRDDRDDGTVVAHHNLDETPRSGE